MPWWSVPDFCRQAAHLFACLKETEDTQRTPIMARVVVAGALSEMFLSRKANLRAMNTSVEYLTARHRRGEDLTKSGNE
jgi:hypothetical protein